jgi:hypothetical protein
MLLLVRTITNYSQDDARRLWGTAPQTDVFYKTSGKHDLRRSDYSDGYHTYGLEWSQNYLYTYLDSRLLQVLYVGFGSKYGDMYTRGGFANMPLNGSVYVLLHWL